MIIGITTTYVEEEQKDEIVPVERVTVEYVRRVAAAGAVPVLLPPVEGGADANRRAARELVERLDGLVLAGGGDLNPATYGDEARLAETVNVFDGRDALELELARLAHERDLPMLGICRGIQFLNAALGGTLWQDLPVQCPSPVDHHQTGAYDKPIHTVRLLPDTPLANLLQREVLPVNSYHHQAVKDLSPILCAAATSEDGLVEAAWMPGKHFILGVQWHPEFAYKTDPASMRLFEAFVKAAKYP